jgi:hypothetical protein
MAYNLSKNQFHGETIFILGNGKSLRWFDLSLLHNKYTFCFNRFYLAEQEMELTWKPLFYTVADEGIIQDYGAEITEYIKDICFPCFPAHHPSGYKFSDHVSGNNIWWYYLSWGNESFRDIRFLWKQPLFGLNATAASVGIQIAAWLGFKTIYLLGVDMDYKIPEDDTTSDGRNIVSQGYDINHFSPYYFSKGHRYHMPRLDIMLDKLGQLNGALKAKGIRLVNLNPKSNFRECEFGDYYQAVKSV